MSVKGKVKRCNNKINELEREIKKLKNIIYSREFESSEKERLLENILKFAISNHIGELYGGIAIERYDVDKLNNLKLIIDNDIMTNSFIIKIHY